MRVWLKALLGMVLAVSVAGCGGKTKVMDPDKSAEPVGLQITGPQLRQLSNDLANKLRGENFFIKAVSNMRGKLDQTPNAGLVRVRNNTTYDDINMAQAYRGFQEAFYTTDKVAFTRNMPNPHLKMRFFLNETRRYGDDGTAQADYEARVQVMKLVLSDDPDQPAVGEKVIGNVSETLTLQKDNTVF